MPEPESIWEDDAQPVEGGFWEDDAVKAPTTKTLTAGDRAAIGVPVFEGDRDPSAPREEISEGFVARDRAEGGTYRGRVTQLGPTDISVDPRTGDSAASYDPAEDTEADLYEPAADVRARTPGIEYTRDDTVSLRDWTPAVAGARLAAQGGMPGLSSALEYAGSMVPDARYSPGAMATGASDTLTLGHTDELAGAIGAAGEGTYTDERDAARQRRGELAQRHPGSYLTGVAGGALPMMAAPGAAQLAGARGAGALGRVGAALGEGTVLGAVAGSGASEAELGTPEHLLDTSTGGVVGGAVAGGMQGAGEAVGAGVRRFAGDPDELLEDASMLRVRGMFGGERPPRRTLRETFGARRGRGERTRQLVTELRALGIRNADDAPRVHEQAGEAMDDIATRVDEMAAARPRPEPPPQAAPPPAPTPEPQVTPEDIIVDAAGRFRDRRGRFYRRGADGQPIIPGAGGYREPAHAGEHVVSADRIAQRIREHAAQLRQTRGVDDSVVGAMEREAERWEQAAAQSPMTFRRAWQFRQEMGRPEYWTVGPRGEMSPAQQFRRDLYGIVRDELDAAVTQASPQLAQQWRQQSRTYSILSPFVEAAEEARFRGVQNRQVSPTDYLGAVAGFTSGGAAGAVAGGIVNRGVRAYEHTVKASGLERLSRLVQRDPGQLGPYGSVLQNALNRSPAEFSASWFVLSQQHPELQERMQQIDEGEDNVGTY